MPNRTTKPRLLLHAGTPKTGTTSVQFFLDRCSDELRSKGILYPRIYPARTNLQGERMPKHQWIVDDLLEENYGRYAACVSSVRSELTDAIHTVMLSTEGLYNHWWDFSSGAKQQLSGLGTWFAVNVVIVFRDPHSFASSLYRQACLNPRDEKFRCYGQDLPIEAVLDDEWFSKRFDYAGFIEECEAMFGPDSVLPVKYEDTDIVARFKKLLELGDDFGGTPEKRNESLTAPGLELVRIINRYPLDHKRKREAVQLIRQLEAILGERDASVPVSDDAKRRIAGLSARSRTMLAERFGISWS